MPDTETTPHEDAAIALRRIIAEKHAGATETQVHEHEGQFVGMTFVVRDHGQLRHFYWIDPTGTLPERPRYAREDAAAVLPLRAARAAARITPGPLWTRAGEEQLSLRQPDAGDCTRCGKQLAEGMFRWTDREPELFEGEFGDFFGDGRFSSLRHADGSQNHGARDCLSAKTACSECLRTGITVKDTGHGWETSCPHCGHQSYTDSGD